MSRIETIEQKGDAGPWSMSKEGLLLFHKYLYVPEDSAFRQELLAKHHDDPLSGHFCYERTLEILRRYYNWPGLAKEIRKYIEICDIYQCIKAPRHKPYRSIKSLPIRGGP